jgi:hypothetical protein
MRLPDLSRLVRKSRRGGPPLTRDEALGARPIRNPVITWEAQDNGKVLLTVPLELKPWMRLARVVVKVPEERQVELDEVGSDVWQWLDGEHSVDEVIGLLADRHKLNRREAEVSLTQFLQTLAKRRFVGFAVAMDEQRAEELRRQGALASQPEAEPETSGEAADG